MLVGLAILATAVSLVLIDGNRKKEKSQADLGRIEQMDLEKLKAGILDKDWDALDIVDEAAQPEQALDLLTDLCGHDDPETRELALNCVALVNADARVPNLLAGALGDEDEDVRLYALQALQTAYDESILDVLISNLESEDRAIRGGVALLLGQIEKPEATEPLRQRLTREKDETVGRDMKLALAKLGDSGLKDEFASQMDVADSGVRMQAIEDLRYIGARDLAVRIRPALDDLGQGHMIGTMSEPVPVFARVCDAALNLIAELCDNPFSFEADKFKVYSDEEVAEAKKYLEGLESGKVGELDDAG